MSIKQELDALGYKFQLIRLAIAREQRQAASEVPDYDPDKEERFDEWSEHVINSKRDAEGYKTPLALPSHNEDTNR